MYTHILGKEIYSIRNFWLLQIKNNERVSGKNESYFVQWVNFVSKSSIQHLFMYKNKNYHKLFINNDIDYERCLLCRSVEHLFLENCVA